MQSELELSRQYKAKLLAEKAEFEIKKVELETKIAEFKAENVMLITRIIEEYAENGADQEEKTQTEPLSLEIGELD